MLGKTIFEWNKNEDKSSIRKGKFFIIPRQLRKNDSLTREGKKLKEREKKESSEQKKEIQRRV